MTGLYSINGNDIYTAYGLVITSGVGSLLDMPDRKSPYSHDWQDENGVEVDLSRPLFQARQVTFNVVLEGNGYADFWAKYKALFELLSSPGLLELYCADLGSTFHIYYTSSSNFQRHTRLRSGQVIMSFTLVFTEPVPIAGGGDVYVWSQDGENIITQDGTNKIQIK